MPSLFGPALRKARKRAGQTIEQLSGTLGFSTTYLSDIERGLRPPLSGDKIVEAANECGVDPETLSSPAARDRGFVKIPVTAEMSDEVLTALVRMRVKLSKSKTAGLKELRALVVHSRR